MIYFIIFYTSSQECLYFEALAHTGHTLPFRREIMPAGWVPRVLLTLKPGFPAGPFRVKTLRFASSERRLPAQMALCVLRRRKIQTTGACLSPPLSILPISLSDLGDQLTAVGGIPVIESDRN